MKGDARMRAMTQRVVDRLATEYAPDRIILFGSFAYGQPDADSDIDLLIIKETSARFVDRVAEVCRAVAGLHPHVPFEPIILTPNELEERLRAGDPFFQEIVEKGELLYAA